jgi:uncharacterized protein (AIM24 family)
MSFSSDGNFLMVISGSSDNFLKVKYNVMIIRLEKEEAFAEANFTIAAEGDIRVGEAE